MITYLLKIMNKPIQLISINSDGKCELNPEAEEFISKIDRNIAVVCVTGLYRTGKSYLLNRLLDRQDGFEIGSTIKSCTKGIWVWCESLSLKNQEVLILDSEGLGSAFDDRNESIDMEIFVLSILLSSYFIYNSMKTIDEASIEALSLVINFAKKIQGEFNQVESYTNNFPTFLWVVRDFALNLVNQEGKSITPKEYLEEALGYSNNDLNESKDEGLARKNEIRKLIKLFFKERDCKTIVRPVSDDKKLRSIDKIPESELRPEFLRQMKELVSYIFKGVRPKVVQGSFLNGEMYLSLIKSYLKAINMNSLPDIKSSWKSMVDSQVDMVQERSFNKYLEHMLDIDYSSVVAYEQILKNSQENQQAAFSDLKQLATINIPCTLLSDCYSKLSFKINDQMNDLINKWKDLSTKHCYGIYNDLVKEYNENNNIDILTILEVFSEIHKFIDDSVTNAKKYEVIYPLINKFFIDNIKKSFLEDKQKQEIQVNLLKSEKESLQSLLQQTKKLMDSNRSEFEREIKKIKDDSQQARLDLESRIDERNRMIKSIQASNDTLIEDLKGNIEGLQSQIETKNKEIQIVKSKKQQGGGGSYVYSSSGVGMPDSIVEGIMSKLDGFKESILKSEIEKARMTMKQEISYRIEDMQEEFQKKISQLKRDCEKLVLQVKADSKREIEEFKQIIKNQYDEITDYKCQVNSQDYKIELFKEKIISYEKEKKTQQEHAELLKLLTMKLNSLMDNFNKRITSN